MTGSWVGNKNPTESVGLLNPQSAVMPCEIVSASHPGIASIEIAACAPRSSSHFRTDRPDARAGWWLI
jgi:hypothetical protein